MPILLPMLATAGSAYLQHRGQKKQLERDEARNKELLNKNRAEAAKRQAEVEGSFGVNKYALEALEQARGKQGVKEAQDQANLGAANQIELAARLGARGGVNAAAIERGRQNQVLQAGAAQRKAERAALNTVSQEKSQLDTARRGYNFGLFNRADATAARAQENLFNVQDAQANLGRNLATNMISAAMPMLGAIGSGNFKEQMIGGGNPLTQNGGDPYYGQNDPYFVGPMPPPGFSNENGGKIRGGRKGMKTPGQFSHASNPINLMQGGSKVGEVTGGEYVVNPSQAKKIAEQSAYARMLFKKFDKEA